MKDGWSPTPLASLLRPAVRPAAALPDKEYRLLGVRLDGGGAFLRERKLGSEIAATTLYRVCEGDFIYSRLFAWRGAFGVINQTLDGCYVSGEFPTFVCDANRIDAEFLRLWFRLPATLDAVEARCSGSTPLTRNRFKEQFFLATQLPLPPLAEQRRIVARIEALAGKIEEARRLRAETGSDRAAFLERSADERLSLERWPKVELHALLREDTQNGLSARPSDGDAGVPILRISAATSRRDAIVDEADVRYLNLAASEVPNYLLEPGDLLACRFNGNLRYVGRFALYKGHSELARVYPDKLIRFRLDTARAVPEYIRYAMNSTWGRATVEAFCATTAGNIGISAGNLKKIQVPLPPLSEQWRMVDKIGCLNAQLDQLGTLQSDGRAELDALLPALLRQAFAGEL